jgi:hypothetical protein
MIRRVDYLIEASRQATENTQYTDTAGIQDSEFIRYLNDAQDEIHAIINTTFPMILMKDKEISLVQGQESYTIPRDVYLGTRIDTVEFSNSGNAQNYYPIKKGSMKERLNGVPGNPSFYIRRSDQLLIQPTPQSSGSIRVTYQYSIPRLDLRRGQVIAPTAVNQTTKTITDLYLDPLQVIQDTELLADNFITIVDKNGAVKMRSIPITAINTTTGQVTIEAGFTFESGETIEVGDYACRGIFSSTTSQLPDICERFLIEYCNTRILMRDSNTDQDAITAIMAKAQDTITKAFSEPDSDPAYVPILDTQYFGWDVF